MNEIIKKCPNCGAEYTRETWAELPRVGRQDDGVEALELRNCTCKSTIAVDVGPVRVSRHCGVTGDHANCPRETTLGTSLCECPCHEAKPGRLN